MACRKMVNFGVGLAARVWGLGAGGEGVVELRVEFRVPGATPESPVPNPQPLPPHSARNATTGSTLVARRAGSQQARSATAANPATTATKVAGSVGEMP